MIYPSNISDFFEENNRQIVTNFEILLFNTQVNALKCGVRICTFSNVMIASLLQYKKAIKFIAGEANIITVTFFQAASVLFISSDTLKVWGEKVKEQHKIINKGSR